MKIGTYRKRFQKGIDQAVGRIELSLLELKAEWEKAKADLSPSEFTKFDDWSRKKLSLSGLGDAFFLVVDVGVDADFVAKNMDVASELYSMSAMPIGKVAMSVLKSKLKSRSERASLALCSKVADLYFQGLPYPLPDGTLVDFRKASRTKRLAVKEFAVATSVSPAKTTKTVNYHKMPRMTSLRMAFEKRKGAQVAVLVMRRKDGRGGEVVIDWDEAKREAAKVGL